MYKVIKEFTDMFDDGHKYNVGDEFPRKGLKVNEGRIAKLASDANRQKTPLIVEEKSLNLASPAQSEKVEQGIAPKKSDRKKKES